MLTPRKPDDESRDGGLGTGPRVSRSSTGRYWQLTPRDEYRLTAGALDSSGSPPGGGGNADGRSLTSRGVRLNGARAELHVGSGLEPRRVVAPAAGSGTCPEGGGEALVLGAHSYGFFMFHNASAAACMSPL